MDQIVKILKCVDISVTLRKKVQIEVPAGNKDLLFTFTGENRLYLYNILYTHAR